MLTEKKEKNIIIVGAGRAGKLLAQDIKLNHQDLKVIGFVDDAVHNKSVLGKISDLPKLLGIYNVEEVIIAIPSTDGKLIRSILLENEETRIPFKIVPRNQRIISKSDVRYVEVRDLESGDFLGRPFMRKGVEKLKNFYRGKTVFVTGGAGSIGSEIVWQLIDLEVRKVVIYDNSEYLVFLLEQRLKEQGMRDRCELVVGSILHDNKLKRLFSEYKPDMIFHAAAYKHVHLMQENVDESVYNNVIGTKRVIDTAIEMKVPYFTFISTDKVVNPTSVMGATKKLCEYYIRHLKSGKTKFNIVRFGNVINSNGSVLPLFERQMMLYQYVTVTHKKMMRFFMSIREAAQLVIESSAFAKPNAIHILNMGELINIDDIARCLIRSKNLIPETDVAIRVIGLRKGEKLVEELYTDIEKKNLIQSKTENVFILKNDECCPMDIDTVFVSLEHLVKRGENQSEVRKVLQRIFPSLKKR